MKIVIFTKIWNKRIKEFEAIMTKKILVSSFYYELKRKI